MGRVFLVGDIHGELERLTNFIDRFELDKEKDNTIIVLGDMGLYWRKDKRDADAFLKFYESYHYKTHIFFIDGNHENFDLLDNLPYKEGTNFKKCSDYIHYIPRGTVFQLYIGNELKTFLACGGADSIDKFRRTPHLSWWKQEQITKEDIDLCIKNAETRHIDYVLTHCCPRSIFEENKVYLITLGGVDQSSVDHTSEDRLEELKQKIDFDKWYFGHYHIDKQLDDKFTCLFYDFIELK